MTDIIIFCAEYLFLFSIVIFLYYGYTAPNKKEFIKLALLTGIIAFGLSLIASALYYNPRPFMVTGVPPLVAHAPGNGFPSDHALLTGTIAAIVTVTSPYLGALLWLIAIAVSVARVLAGVHHSIDIIGSFIIAIVSAIATQYFLKRYASPGK